MSTFLIFLFSLGLLTAPVADNAYAVDRAAFSQCDSTAVSESGALIAEEGSDPVVSGGWAYVGYTRKTDVIVIPASDKGSVLGTPATIFHGPGRSTKLRLSASDPRIYAAWLHHEANGFHLMFAVSRDHGSDGTWTVAQDFGPASSNIPQISADGGSVHVAYFLPDGTATVVTSTNSGRDFSAPVLLGPGSGEIVVVGHQSNVYVSWETGNTPRRSAMFAVSHDAGASFSVRNLSDDGHRHAREPILALAALNNGTERLSMVWREDHPTQGVYLQSTDAGTTWSNPLVVAVGARQVMVADDGGNIYVSYLLPLQVNGNDDWQTFLAVSSDGGQSFPSPQNLSGPSGISKLEGDLYRPMPWGSGGHLRLTGIKADGAYVWSGTGNSISDPVYLGAGDTASPQNHVAAWLAPEGIAMYAYCQ